MFIIIQRQKCAGVQKYKPKPRLTRIYESQFGWFTLRDTQLIQKRIQDMGNHEGKMVSEMNNCQRLGYQKDKFKCCYNMVTALGNFEGDTPDPHCWFENQQKYQDLLAKDDKSKQQSKKTKKDDQIDSSEDQTKKTEKDDKSKKQTSKAGNKGGKK